MAPLNITIIGAGIAGCSAARACREQHNVTIVERFEGGNEVGAAINLGPTATQILDAAGFDRKRAKAITATMARTYNKEGVELSTTDFSAFHKNCPADWQFVHRHDLWSELLRLATASSDELGIPGKPSKVIWGGDVVDIDVDSGDVTLADGSKIESDLVVAADGIRSIARPLVVGEDAYTSARPSGASAFRFTIPADVAREVRGDISALDATKPVGLDVFIAQDATNRSIVMYPCRDYALLNFVCIVPDSIIGLQTTESWSAEGQREDLLRCYDDFGPYIKEMLKRAEDVKLWQLRDQDPLPTYVRGRCILVGDAAHAMTPHQGQGGTQAIEDAEAFTLFNIGNPTRSQVPQLLREIDCVRRPRAGRIQTHTREAHQRKTPQDLYKHNLYNWTYPGIEKCLSRLDAGKEMIVL